MRVRRRHVVHRAERADRDLRRRGDRLPDRRRDLAVARHRHAGVARREAREARSRRSSPGRSTAASASRASASIDAITMRSPASSVARMRLRRAVPRDRQSPMLSDPASRRSRAPPAAGTTKTSPPVIAFVAHEAADVGDSLAVARPARRARSAARGLVDRSSRLPLRRVDRVQLRDPPVRVAVAVRGRRGEARAVGRPVVLVHVQVRWARADASRRRSPGSPRAAARRSCCRRRRRRASTGSAGSAPSARPASTGTRSAFRPATSAASRAAPSPA